MKIHFGDLKMKRGEALTTPRFNTLQKSSNDSVWVGAAFLW